MSGRPRSNCCGEWQVRPGPGQLEVRPRHIAQRQRCERDFAEVTSFEHLREWLDETKQYAPLTEPGQAEWSLRKGEVTQMLLDANDTWAKLDGEARKESTLVLEDGIELKLW